MSAINFAGFPIVIDETLPPGKWYMMPAEVYDLIQQAKDGKLSWGFVIEEVTQAAKDGRIGIIDDIG